MTNQLALIHVPQVEVLDPIRPTSPAEQLFSFGQMIAQTVADQVIERLKPVRLTDAEEAREWAKAWDEWLHTAPKSGDARPAATIRAYGNAWADFRKFCKKEARFVNSRDVANWIETLRTRLIDPSVETGLIANGRRQTGQAGLSARTVGQYIAAISSFYSYVERYEAQTDAGQIVPLVALDDWRNPAKSHAVKRPQVKKFGEDVVWLSDAQLKALKNVIRSAQTLADLQTGVASRAKTVQELRDYALFRAYMLTGARNREVREWRWGDLKERGGAVYYRWANKGKSGTDELARPCYDAVLDYLRLAGRLDTIQADDFIFQPGTDTITRLRRDDGSPVVDAATWDRNRPISPGEVNRLLRKYCQQAGIEAAEIHVHSLRHSANMLYEAQGVPVEARSEMLHHSSLDMTRGYTHRQKGQQNPHWKKASDWLDG